MSTDVEDAVRGLLTALAYSSSLSGDHRLGIRRYLAEAKTARGVLAHALLDRPVSWHEIALFLASNRVFWAAIPLPLFDASLRDIRPLSRAMGARLFTAPTDDDHRSCYVVLKRLRRYVLFGRPRKRDRKRLRTELVQQNNRCASCGYYFKQDDISAYDYLDEPDFRKQARGLNPPEVDHIIPVYLAGDSKSNTQVLCQHCNRSKGGTLAWPNAASLMAPFRPSDLRRLTRASRWMVLNRDGRCVRCERLPTQLQGVRNRLVVVSRHAEYGWVLENMESCCLNCRR